MDLTDFIIILLLIIAIVRGAEAGSVRQIFSTGGFFGGLFIGAWLSTKLVHLAHGNVARSWLTLLVTLGCALLVLIIGEYVGNLLKFTLQQHHLERLDRLLGAVVGIVAMAVFVWLGAAMLIGLPYPGLQNQLRGSAIVSALDNSLPSAPNVIATLSHVIDPNGFPQVFAGNEPAPTNQNLTLPPPASLVAAVAKDQVSVVKVEGSGCGGIVEGSGFVIAPGLVATNAHVVAGVAQPYVQDNNGNHQARVIWFNPNLDLALLQVSDLAGHPLKLNSTIAANGSAAGVLGYPGGGPFNAGPAAVMDEFIATGRNIYDQGTTNRSVYEIKATVIPGNSGGPLITTNGTVIGIVFAESTTYNHVGYALTLQKVVTQLHQAEAKTHTVSTGTCAE